MQAHDEIVMPSLPIDFISAFMPTAYNALFSRRLYTPTRRHLPGPKRFILGAAALKASALISIDTTGHAFIFLPSPAYISSAASLSLRI